MKRPDENTWTPLVALIGFAVGFIALGRTIGGAR